MEEKEGLLPRGKQPLEELKNRLEFVAYAKSDARPQAVDVEICSSAIMSNNTHVRTPIQRELEGEPEIILNSKMSYSTNKPIGSLETIDTSTCTDTHIPVPFTFFVPRNSSIERINPIVGTSCTDTIKEGHVHRQVNHVGCSKTVLVRNINTIAKVYTDSTGLCYCKRDACYCHYGSEKKLLHNLFL